MRRPKRKVIVWARDFWEGVRQTAHRDGTPFIVISPPASWQTGLVGSVGYFYTLADALTNARGLLQHHGTHAGVHQLVDGQLQRVNWENKTGGKVRHGKSHGAVVRRREAKLLKWLGWLPKSKAKDYNPERYDFEWNKDYTKFRARPLQWWDDASYARYQSEDPYAYEGGKKRHAGGKQRHGYNKSGRKYRATVSASAGHTLVSGGTKLVGPFFCSYGAAVEWSKKKIEANAQRGHKAFLSSVSAEGAKGAPWTPASERGIGALTRAEQEVRGLLRK